jgi:hypothetical protein
MKGANVGGPIMTMNNVGFFFFSLVVEYWIKFVINITLSHQVFTLNDLIERKKHQLLRISESKIWIKTQSVMLHTLGGPDDNGVRSWQIYERNALPSCSISTFF